MGTTKKADANDGDVETPVTKTDVQQTMRGIDPRVQAALDAAMGEEVQSQAWKPEKEGDFIDGVVASMKLVPSSFDNGDRVMVQLRTAGSEAGVRVYCQTQLAEQMTLKGVGTGDRILIAYRGLVKDNKGNEGRLKLFSVQVLTKSRASGADEQVPF